MAETPNVQGTVTESLETSQLRCSKGGLDVDPAMLELALQTAGAFIENCFLGLTSITA